MKDKIHYAHKTQTQAYISFMLALQGCRIVDINGQEIRKLDFFNSIFLEHEALYPGVHFDLKKSIKFSLLKDGMLVDYKLIGTPEPVEYNDSEVYRERATDVIKKHCNAVCRKINCSCDEKQDIKLKYGELLGLAIECALNVFNTFPEIEREVDLLYT